MIDLLGVGASALSGGVLGVAGTVIGRVAGYFEKRQEHAFEEKRWANAIKIAEMERAAKAEAASQSLALAATQGSFAGLTASIDADAKLTDVPKWVSAVRALIRPWITVMADAALIVFAFVLPDMEMRESVVEAVVLIAMTSTVWWFGDRAPQIRRGAK